MIIMVITCDYEEFVAVLEHISQGGNEDVRYSIIKWRDENPKPVKKTPRSHYVAVMSHLTTQAMRHYPRKDGTNAHDEANAAKRSSDTSEHEIHLGHVLCWFEDKRFGFLKPEDGGQDVFVHHKAFSDAK